MKEAKQQVKDGYAVLDWACTGDITNPDVVVACAGHEPTEEALAAVNYIKKLAPKLSIKFINVLNLMKLSVNHPDDLSDKEFDKLFTTDKPIIFNFHGYAGLIKQFFFDRTNKNVKVFGYQEEGTITTSFDMSMRNNVDRCHIAMAIAQSSKLAPATKTKINKEMTAILERHTQHIKETNTDLPEIENWHWGE